MPGLRLAGSSARPTNLAWFFGGAALSLAALALYLGRADPAAVVGVDPAVRRPAHRRRLHRTYLDTASGSAAGRCCWFSLLLVRVRVRQPGAVRRVGSSDPFLLFIALSAF
jgi:hypothetical protein